MSTWIILQAAKRKREEEEREEKERQDKKRKAEKELEDYKKEILNKRTFNQWLTLLKFKEHRVVEEWGARYHKEMINNEEVYTLENRKGERIKLGKTEYLLLKEITKDNKI